VTYDRETKGFGARVTAAGGKAFILNYRRKSDGLERRYTIGAFPDWSAAVAREEAKRLKRHIDGGGDPVGEHQADRAAPTMADLCERFIEEYLPRKRPSTQKEYRLQIASEILPRLGRLKVANVTFSNIDALHHGITAKAPYRANRVVALLSRMFSMAIRWHWRTDNPCTGIERNQEHKRRRYLSADELTRLIRGLDEHRDRQSADIIRLLLLTGARRGEVLQARWEDFDLVSGVWSKSAATTKQKTEHRVPLSDAARQLLLDLRYRVAVDAEWVFPARDGLPRRDVKDAWANLCRAADITDARVHDLRHTYASVLASAGLSLPIIGQLLGHTTPTTTARYAHLCDDPLRAATERASAIITSRPAAPVVPFKKEGVS
jgi:integrase